MDSTRTADQLYRSARRWFVDAFKDAEEVIQLEDDSARTIVGKGWFNYHDMGRIWFTVEVAAKAGRYRVRFYNFNHVGVGGLTSGTTYVPYLDYGPIYAGAECYTPKPTLMIVEGTEKEMMLIHCADHTAIDKEGMRRHGSRSPTSYVLRRVIGLVVDRGWSSVLGSPSSLLRGHR